LIADIESDLGGADQLAAAERQLVQHGAILGAVLTDMEAKWLRGGHFDLATYCTTINCQRRVFEEIGAAMAPLAVPIEAASAGFSESSFVISSEVISGPQICNAVAPALPQRQPWQHCLLLSSSYYVPFSDWANW
jgi:hypothetical protein